jgi:ABC-2 type transport system permease protein
MVSLFRIEFYKQFRRLRTLVAFGVVIGLPILIATAIHARNRPDRERREGLFRLARLSGLVMPAATLAVMSAFLLVIVVAMFAGDSVAGDASSGNLRYVLLRPVNRTKLLSVKLVVTLLMTWFVTIAVAASGLAIGVAYFGWKPLALPVGTLGLAGPLVLSTGTLIGHLALATAYVAFGLTAIVAVGTFFSVLSDNPAGAIGAAVGVYIVSSILDGIEALGVVRYGFPTHYSSVWERLFTDNNLSHDIWAGVGVQLGWLAVFAGLSIWWFGRKDIKS